VIQKRANFYPVLLHVLIPLSRPLWPIPSNMACFLAWSSPLSPMVCLSLTWTDRFLIASKPSAYDLFITPMLEAVHTSETSGLPPDYMVLYPRKLPSS
jgi:hypothetical protein